jgi:hypothetical protein
LLADGLDNIAINPGINPHNKRVKDHHLPMCLLLPKNSAIKKKINIAIKIITIISAIV